MNPTSDLLGNTKGRIANLDILRAVAALLVCFYHFNRNSLYGGTFYPAITRYGHYGVDIFFVISGYVIPLALYKSQFNLGRLSAFLKARWIRLYPAYFAASILTLGLWYASTTVPGFQGTVPHVTVPQILANISLSCDFFKQDWFGIVFWTLAIEAQYYVLVALAFPFLTSGLTRTRIFTLALWIAAPIFAGQGPTVFTWTSLFGIGILAFMLQQRLISGILFWIFLSFACGVQWFIRSPVSTLLGAITVLCILYLPPIKSRGLIWIGGISYSLYLLHVPIGGRVMNVIERYPESFAVKLFAIPLALAASLLAAYMYWRFIEAPSHAAARKIKLRTV